MAIVTVHCPRCQSAQVYLHGQKTLKAVLGFAAVTAIVYFCSPTPMKPVSPASKSKSPKWRSTEQVSAIPQGHSKLE